MADSLTFQSGSGTVSAAAADQIAVYNGATSVTGFSNLTRNASGFVGIAGAPSGSAALTVHNGEIKAMNGVISQANSVNANFFISSGFRYIFNQVITPFLNFDNVAISGLTAGGAINIGYTNQAGVGTGRINVRVISSTGNNGTMVIARSIHRESTDTVTVESGVGDDYWIEDNAAIIHQVGKFGMIWIELTNKDTAYSFHGKFANAISEWLRIQKAGTSITEITVQSANDDLRLSKKGTGRLDFTLDTTTTAPAAGGGGILPVSPTGYLRVKINGVNQTIPYYPNV